MKNLALLLSYARALYQMYQHMHWKCDGPNYYSDHLLYERLYEDMQGELDAIAEKAVGMGDDFSPLSDSSAASGILGSMVSNDDKADDYPKLAIKSETHFLDIIKEVIKKGVSDGVEDLLQGVANKHEEHLYLLKQRAGVKEAGLAKRASYLAIRKEDWSKAVLYKVSQGGVRNEVAQVSGEPNEVREKVFEWRRKYRPVTIWSEARKKYNINKRGEKMLVKLFKLAHTLDKKGYYNEASEIEAVMKTLSQRVGLELEDMVSLADYCDEQGDTALANHFDAMAKQAANIK